ncbi:SCO family protein [Lysobacter pythonis]|uniref:SCO family protein n=1 Tax=Solilutibacter pythonis TaxID=2483112 RepID=A0A3M2I1G1_9GAMM|nr:SCO family protein [Lysobacter pythonis]RMH94978.1 SCO family protein [Lysobacter pythonis]
MFNRTTLIIVALAAVAAGLFAGARIFSGPATPSGPALETVKRFDTPRELPPFELIRDDGQALTNESLKGHWTLVFIGFTHCPDICPTTLAQLKLAQKQWEALPAASRPRVLFVSVDPQRDTPELTGKYAHAFHPDTIAATGELPKLENFARSLSLVFMKQPPTDSAHPDRYSVDHSAALAVLDPQARMAGVIQPDPASHSLAPDKIARDFIALSESEAAQ